MVTDQSGHNPRPGRPPLVAPPLSNGRERFTSRELDEVLGLYELGDVSSVREVALGTPTSPKAVIDCARGRLLLKRRARGVDAPGLVAFSHRVALGALLAGVCVPPLVGTRGDNNSMVQVDSRVYELFVFIEGNPDPRSVASSERSGALLGELHAALDRLGASDDGLRDDAPREPSVIDPGRADRSAIDTEIRSSVRGVLERAARHAEPAPEPRLVHGDWHPGNVIYRNDEPVALCDFDNARAGSRARELAQGMAQFSLVRGAPGESPARWPAEADLERLGAHWRGYAGSGAPLPDPAAVLGLIPGVLLEEALGSSNPEIVWAVLRKAQWIEDHCDDALTALGIPLSG
ncbi:MAG: phosphotransferase [Planctomycetota bacterium]